MFTAQVIRLRSQNASLVQHGLGLFAWSTGCSRQMIEVLNKFHITPSITTIMSTLKDLGDRSIEEARRLVENEPHAYQYDNINVSGSDHIEQRPGAPNKVSSGTFPVVYKLHNASFDAMSLPPITERLQATTGLTFYETRPSSLQLSFFCHQMQIHIIRSLTTHCDMFSSLAEHPLLQHKARRPLPRNLRTEYYPLRITTIEEASVKGNILVHDDSYVVQLKQSTTPGSRLLTTAIPLYADLLTLVRTRGTMQHRRGDISAWERREVYQLGMGLFHFLMNLCWIIRSIHYGSINQLGSLSYFFILLDKVRLGNDKPDFHALISTLEQILYGILLHAWELECGFDSLESFARSQPSPEHLLQISRQIIMKYASPMDIPVFNPADNDNSTPNSSNSNSDYTPNPSDDILHQNIRLLTRDLLYVVEVSQAIRDGDFGRIEDIFPDLARIFRGAGSHNYSNEILHFLHNVKKVWSPEFA